MCRFIFATGTVMSCQGRGGLRGLHCKRRHIRGCIGVLLLVQCSICGGTLITIPRPATGANTWHIMEADDYHLAFALFGFVLFVLCAVAGIPISLEQDVLQGTWLSGLVSNFYTGRSKLEALKDAPNGSRRFIDGPLPSKAHSDGRTFAEI